MMQAQIAQGVGDYVSSLPNKSAFELGYDAGYAGEKFTESVLLSYGTGVVVNGVKGVVGATRAARASNRIALGVREGLDDFASSVSGSTWKKWRATDFESSFLNQINNPSTKIHFNLDGIDNVWSAVQQGAKGYKTGGFTNWELFQIYSNPNALNRTTFYLNGKVFSSPF